MTIVFPADPAAQTPVNQFSPTSTPVTNTANGATYVWNAAANQWTYGGPNVSPTPGTVIETPSIVSPADGATGVNPGADVTITSSAYTPQTGTPGTHQSSSWNIVAGALPIVSANPVTAVTQVDQDWTIVNQFSQGNRTLLDCVYRFPNNTVLAFQSYNSGQSSNYWVFTSTDNGQTWTDRSNDAGGVSSGRNYHCGWSSSDQNHWQSCCVYQVQSGPYEGDILAMLWSNRANFGRGWWYYDWSTDTFTGYGQGNYNNSVKELVLGQFNNILYLGRSNATSSFDLDNPPGGYPGGNINSVPGRFMFFNDNGAGTWWGWKYNNNSLQSDPSEYFLCTDPTDLSNSTIITDETLGTVDKGKVFWIPQIARFALLCSGGTVGLFNPDDQSLESLATGTTDTLRDYWFDGINHIFTTEQLEECVITQDFELFTVLSDGAPMVRMDDGSYINITRNRGISDSDSLRINRATSYSDNVRLTIAGAQTEGFQLGNPIENRGGLEASGTITTIDDTALTLLPFAGTWQGNSTQRIAIPATEFNVVVDDRQDTANLTSYTIPAAEVMGQTDYRARVQYQSNSNVVSDVSPWSSFETS